MRFYIFTFFILIFTIQVAAQTPLPYETGFDTTEEQGDWTFFQTGGEGFYTWNFSMFEAHSAPSSLSHSYPVGGTELTNDWMVSPEFNFANGGSVDSLWMAAGGFGMPMGEDTIALYLFVGSGDPAQANSKILLHLFSDENYMNDNTWRLFTNINIPAVSGETYLAFRYQTTNNWLDVRFDDMKVSGVEVSNINNIENKYLIYPNPAEKGNALTIEGLEEDFSWRIFNIIGKEMSRGSNPQVPILNEWNVGVYFLELINNKQKYTQKIILK